MGLSDFRTGSSGDADTVAARRKPVESLLTLIMTMRSPEDFEVLNGHIHEIQSAPPEQKFHAAPGHRLYSGHSDITGDFSRCDSGQTSVGVFSLA
jgi:hypothetical protein